MSLTTVIVRIQKINANDEFTIFAGPGNADGQFDIA